MMKFFVIAILALCGVVAIGEDSKLKEFSTKDHPKSLGLNVKIAYPEDWEEGTNDNIIKFFIKKEKNVIMQEAIKIKKMDPNIFNALSDISTNDLKSEDFRKMIKQNDTEDIIDCGKVKIRGTPVLLVFSKGQTENKNNIYSFRKQTYHFLYEEHDIIITFFVSGPYDKKNEVEEIYKANENLFIHIACKTDIITKWEKQKIQEKIERSQDNNILKKYKLPTNSSLTSP